MAFTPGSIANKITGGTTTGGFVPGSVANKTTGTKKTGGFVPGSVAGPGAANKDLSTVEGLRAYAESVGLGKQAEEIVAPTPKMSFLQRLSSGLGAFNPAEAILTGQEQNSVLAGAGKYLKGIAQGIGGAITGTDYQGTRRTFADVAEKAGITNGIAKFGIGFIGDVLLDPSTYFGGAIAKGIGRGLGLGSELALKGVGALAPETETGLRLAGTGLKDAFGKAFVAGYKASEGAQTDVISFLSRKSTKLLQAASDQLSNLGVGGLTDAQRLEVGLKTALGKQAEFLLGEKVGDRVVASNLVKEAQATGDFSRISAVDQGLAEKLNVKFDTPEQSEYFAKQQARAKEFAKTAGVEDPYAVYLPFIKKEVVDNFLKEVQSTGVQVGSEGYLKQFRNILTADNIELDPAKAFFTRESQIISNTETRKFLEDFTSRYGKPLEEFASEDAAKQAGLRLLKEKGGFGKALGYVGEWDAKLLNDLIRPEFQTISTLAKATGYDALTSLFKRSVTGPFLPFHVRNYVSGMLQNFEVLGVSALNPKTISAGQKFAYLLGAGKEPVEGILEVAGKSTKMSEVFKAFAERFSGDTFYNNDFIHALDAGATLKQSEKILSKSSLRSTLGFQKGNIVPLVGQDGVMFKSARVVGQFIEHQQKATAYLAALGQGKTIKDALTLAERAGFDYRNLTAFESQVMRRIVPFYSFTRKNIELQLKTLGENPQRINQIIAAFQNLGAQPSAEEKKDLPKYLADSLGIKLADLPNGIKQYISNFGTPIEQFASLFNSNPILQQISTMNPLLKVPIEIGIGKDSFRQKDLKDVYDANEYKLAPQFVKDLLEIREVKKDILARQSNGKLVKTGERTQYIADPVKLLVARSLFTARGITYLDQVFGGDLKGFTKVLKTTTGLKPQQIDTGVQVSLNETAKKRALEDLLKKQGEIATYSRAYVPKN